ncbi:DNA adenine methylase [Salmonella enterica]|nr:DNA adenine methylase [Salmonella enterica]EBZ4117310.1 DNA adenine methylase [Salmonella enterica subsp. enterica serovar Montevideo]ECN8739987.1 DNA adenine methylase [Salmonella enterica subsp. enterica serovar Senftenberg]EDE7845788.1 DNA adenine methylase [Salmonella enterica subsp. enterica serovar Oranienburg]EDV6922335.1 DNA adenine methylase [Salmonella enterica subsp. enterica serovar Soerenga]EED2830841.1 DNA adenine methylase [Salmonella enterica subsp. enterica serovar Vitkin]
MNAVIKHPAIRYHGGKFRLASWIISHFPAYRCYVEPFGGGASVLLKKEPSEAEVYNDLDGDVVNLFRVLRNSESRQALIDACALTPYSRGEFCCAYEQTDDPIEQARRLIVRATMGFGSAGATKGKTGFRLDTRRNSATAQKIWARQPDNLAAVGSRFAGVLIENRDAIQCMRDHDTVSTLHFVDPPYVHETRVETAKNSAYRFEMTNAQHAELLNVLKELRGAVIVCGYNSDLYNNALTGWKRVTRTTAANGSAGSVQRTECLWINQAAQQKQESAE